MASLHSRTAETADERGQNSILTALGCRCDYGCQRRLFIAALVGMDILQLGLAFNLAYMVRFELKLPVFVLDVVPALAYYRGISLVLTVLWLLFFLLFRAYDWNHLLGGTREYAIIANACAVATAGVATGSFVSEDSFVIARGWLMMAFLFTFLCVVGGRLALRFLVYRLRLRGLFTVPTLVIGGNAEALALTQQLAKWRTSGLDIKGVVSDSLPPGQQAVDDLRILGNLESLPKLIERYAVGELVVATSALPPQHLLEIFRTYAMDHRVQLRISSGLFDVFTTGLSVQSLNSVPLISLNRMRLSGVEATLKEGMDRMGSLVGLILLSPLLLAIALLIRIYSPGPILYRRQVLGRGGRVFDAYKFRTMHVNGDALLTAEDRANLLAYHKLKADPRVTPIGRFLRKYSLDELPQLLNVLRGQMSLIGPRMITPAERDRYGKWDMNLLTVKPGLSGLWQVSGRSDIGYEERVRLDMHYIRNYTLWFDIQLLLRTIVIVITGKGAY